MLRLRLSPLFFAFAACGQGTGHDDVDADVGTHPHRDAGIVDLSIPGDPGYDAGFVTDGALADGGAADGSAGDAEYDRPLPENVSFETAARLTPDDRPQLQDERYFGQVDYYVFTGERGAFYEVTTDRHLFSPDTVISVYDADQILLAQNDDGSIWAGDAVDARVIVHAQASGDIFVKVEDPYTPADFFMSSLPLLYYHPRVRKITEETPGFAIESSAGLARARFATDADSNTRYVTLVGSTGTGEDAFAFDGVADQVLAARVLGMENHSATTDEAWTDVRVLDSAAHVLAQIESVFGQEALHPPIGEASYELRVHTNDTGHPALASYAIDIVLIEDNPHETDDTLNNTPAGADPVTFAGTAARRGLLLSSLPAGDVDYYRIVLGDAERVAVNCEAASGGSRVRGLRAEVVDGEGNVLGAGAESLSVSLAIDPVSPPAAGTYFLRLASTTPVEEVAAAAWVRCLVRIGM